MPLSPNDYRKLPRHTMFENAHGIFLTLDVRTLVNFDIWVLGLVNFVFANWLPPLRQGKLAQSTFHTQI